MSKSDRFIFVFIAACILLTCFVAAAWIWPAVYGAGVILFLAAAAAYFWVTK